MMTKEELFSKVLNESKWHGRRISFMGHQLDDVDPADLDDEGYIDTSVYADKYPHKITTKYDLKRYDQHELERVSKVYPDGFDRDDYAYYLFNDGIKFTHNPSERQIKSKQAYWKKAHGMTDVEAWKFFHLTDR